MTEKMYKQIENFIMRTLLVILYSFNRHISRMVKAEEIICSLEYRLIEMNQTEKNGENSEEEEGGGGEGGRGREFDISMEINIGNFLSYSKDMF